MGPRLIHLTPADYVVSQWSGGATTQLAIAPQGARYGDRDFLWRLSSATVEVDQSEFTPLPDYHRLIAPLRGEMVLTHDGGAPISLRPCQVHAFDGGADTRSTGRCVDFNLMLRKGACSGRIFPVRLQGEGRVPLDARAEADELLLYCVEGGGTVRLLDETVRLTPGETVRIKAPGRGTPTLECQGPAVFMAAEICKA